MSYEEKIGSYIETNWSMGRNDVIDGACSWARQADQELEAKNQKIKEISNALVKHLHEEDSYIDEIEANKKEIAELKAKIDLATGFAADYAYIHGAHHKNWVINEMLSSLMDHETRQKLGWNNPDWLEECIAP